MLTCTFTANVEQRAPPCHLRNTEEALTGPEERYHFGTGVIMTGTGKFNLNFEVQTLTQMGQL